MGLFYRRVKTGKTFYRPMNRVVHAHPRSIAPENPQPDDPVVLGEGSRPNTRFQELCSLANIKPRKNVETGEDEPWELKDLRKTCATCYDEHVPVALTVNARAADGALPMLRKHGKP